MLRLILRYILAALLGAIIGAVGMFVLTEGLPEGAVTGGIMGVLSGAGFAAWIDIRRDEANRAIRGKSAGKRSATAIEKEEMLRPRGQDLHGPYR